MSDERVRSQARKAVRAAALQPDHQVRQRAGDAVVLFSDGDQVGDRREARLELVVLALGREGPDAGPVGDVAEQGIELVGFAAEAEDQDPAGIGVLRQRGLKIGSTTGYNRPIMEVVVPIAAAGGYSPDNLVCGGDLAEGRPSPLM
eukprot:gene10380-biopygen8693